MIMSQIGMAVMGLGLAVGLISVNYQHKSLFLLSSAILGYGLGLLLGASW